MAGAPYRSTPVQAGGPGRGQIRHNQTQMPAADKAFFQVL